MNVSKLRFLNSNAVKLLACLFMLIDHIGFLLFPELLWFRIVGRLALSLFAFTLAEGCRYTKNKVKHLALLAGLALIVQVVYYLYDGSLYMSILVVFTFAEICIYALQFFKSTLFSNAKIYFKILAVLPFVCAVAVTYVVNMFVTLDYGFWGCMLPVFASLLDFYRVPAPKLLQTLDCLPVRVTCMGIGLLILGLSPSGLGYIQLYALLALPILYLYNGEKGKWNIKYFFYIFYPLHLVLLQGIAYLL